MKCYAVVCVAVCRLLTIITVGALVVFLLYSSGNQQKWVIRVVALTAMLAPVAHLVFYFETLKNFEVKYIRCRRLIDKWRQPCCSTSLYSCWPLLAPIARHIQHKLDTLTYNARHCLSGDMDTSAGRSTEARGLPHAFPAYDPRDILAWLCQKHRSCRLDRPSLCSGCHCREMKLIVWPCGETRWPHASQITRKASDVAKYIELFGSSARDRHAGRI